jgi:hypothetical protein
VTSHEYAVSLEFRSIGLEAVPYGGKSAQLKPLRLGEPVAWHWILAPKKGMDDSRQIAMIDMVLHDITDDKPVLVAPAIRVTILVRSTALVPAWLISPQLAISSVIGGLFAVLLPRGVDWVMAWRKRLSPIVRP